jgi:hypothetical protein
LAVRYCGDDVRWVGTSGDMVGTSKEWNEGAAEGKSLDVVEEMFPRCWPTPTT